MKNLWLGIGLVFITGCATTGGRSWEGKISPVHQALIDLAEKKESIVSVALIGVVETSFSAETYERQGLDMRQWKAGQLESTQVKLEQGYLGFLRPYKNAHIVDRAVTEKVMEELQLSISGAMSSEVRLRLGQLTGANYLLLFRVMRFSDGASGKMDELTSRLIAVETGELLASQTVRL